MPPKAKFSKKEIIAAALEIIKRDGVDALTARSLGYELGSSARPIFTVFENMSEVQDEAVKAAKSLYNEYIDIGLKEVLPFKGVGTAYIKFAAEQPKLFQLLFMREMNGEPDTGNILTFLDFNHDKILESIEDSYGFNRDIAKQIYLHLWIYSHGIAVLIATKVCNFTSEEISGLLTTVFVSILKKFKSES